jgi:polysaccharide export outer membrane protein
VDNRKLVSICTDQPGGKLVKKFWGVLLMGLLVVSGCSSSGPSAADLEAMSSSQTRTVDEKYKIGAGDVLNISVWNTPELTLTVPVRPDGYISMPLVGDIRADGIDAATLASNITTQLGTQLRSPQVTVVVAQINSGVYLSRVRVTGAVRNPVSIPYAQGMSVLDVILEAGGVTEVASGNKTKLYRVVNDQLIEVEVNLDDILLRGRLETNFPLMPGDVVTVPESLF